MPIRLLQLAAQAAMQQRQRMARAAAVRAMPAPCTAYFNAIPSSMSLSFFTKPAGSVS